MTSRIPLYYLAHRIAVDMDRQGQTPNLAIRIIINILLMATLGIFACIAFAILDILAWSIGLT